MYTVQCPKNFALSIAILYEVTNCNFLLASVFTHICQLNKINPSYVPIAFSDLIHATTKKNVHIWSWDHNWSVFIE